jgi:cell division protein ZipA
VDFDLRQWLLILGPVFIIGVLLHGYLRMRAGQNQIRMKLDKSFLTDTGDEDVNVDDLSMFKAELPNGGARVINASEDELDEDVPVLMESVDLPSISAIDLPEPEAEQFIDDDVIDIVPGTEIASADIVADEVADEEPVFGKAPPARKQEALPKPEKFVVINVLAIDDPFPGQRLLEILVESNMTLGEMDIFHHLLETGESAFSLASAVEPGTFDMKVMDTFSTPGVTLFMRVHELLDPLKVLDEMLTVADCIALELGGEIRDESRSVMTSQTIEHCRQSIREFQFKHSA